MAYTPTTYWVYPAGCWVDLDTGNVIRTGTESLYSNKIQLIKYINSNSVGNTVWVSKLGDDSLGFGTPEKPFRTLANGLVQLHSRNAGGCMVVDEMNGTAWNESLNVTQINGKRILFSGTNINSISNLLYGNYTPAIYNLKNSSNIESISLAYNCNFKAGARAFLGTKNTLHDSGTPSSPIVYIRLYRNNNNIISSCGSNHDAGTNTQCHIFKNSGISISPFSSISYSSLIGFYYRTDTIPSNSMFGIVASDWAWLTNAWILYDGALLQAGASISPNRMYKITANPNNTSIASISNPSISSTSVGTFFCTSSSATEISRNGLIVELQAHGLQALRDRNWRRFAANIGTDITLNFYGCQVFDSSHDPFIDAANGNYTLKPDSWEATAGPNFEPIGAMGVGKQLTTSDIWTGEPMQNVTIVSPSKATMDTAVLSKFKTNVMNFAGMKLKTLDLLRLDNGVNGEWFALDSNLGSSVTTLIEGNWYINSSNGVPITLSTTNRIISVNQPFFAQTGETSFTGTSTVYALNLRKLTLRLRFSQSSFAADDANVNWYKFVYGQAATVNRAGNTETGAIICGNGDDAYDPTQAFPLGSWNYYQLEVYCQKSEIRGI